VTSRSPARLLAPLALVVTTVALIAILSGGGGGAPESEVDAPPAATSTPAGSGGKSRNRRSSSRRTYTVRPGDTPSAIADREDVSLEALLEANPDVDPNALTPGQKLKLP